jgi:RNA polymerase sigma-70 factor (ECF subfamily)
VLLRYLDELAEDAPPSRSSGPCRLRLLYATFLYKSYLRLTRPPVNLETDELLGGRGWAD